MKRNAVIGVAAGVFLATVVGAYAHTGATGVVKERMDLMKSIGDSMKALTDMMRGKQSYDAKRVRELSGRIGEHGGEKMTELFPEGSLEMPSEALPAIWSDWDRFSALAEQLTSYATALQAAAENERMAPGSGGMMNGGMGQGRGMMMNNGQGMMMGGQSKPSAEHLAEMPPDAAFFHLAQTCSACHQDFRKEQ